MKKHTLLLACAMRILLNLIALPAWGATEICPVTSAKEVISIHAPRMGSDGPILSVMP